MAGSAVSRYGDGERCRRLDATIGIFLQQVIHLNEANRRRDDEFAAPCLLIARRASAAAAPQQVSKRELLAAYRHGGRY
jgi:hypothetical protein